MSLQIFTAKTMEFARVVASHVKEIRLRVGVLNALLTTDKSSVVNAINEVKTQVGGVQNSLGNYIPLSEKGSGNGVATLDPNGKVPTNQLPSYVDDVIDLVNIVTSNPTSGMVVGKKYFNSTTNKILTATSSTSISQSDPEADKIYINTFDEKMYRWSGSIFAQIGGGLVLGETANTAYQGDRGKIGYDHTFRTDNPHGTTKAQVGLGNVQNYGMATSGTANSGTSTTEYMSPKLTKDAVDSWVGVADPNQEYLNNLQ